MSSNIRTKKICQHCKQPFIAQTTVTKFCSLVCAQRNYKKRKREEKITETILSVNEQSFERYAIVSVDNHAKLNMDRLNKEWFNIHDIATLLGVGERTLFRSIKDKSFPRLKIGKRLLFNKQCVIDYFTSKSEGL